MGRRGRAAPEHASGPTLAPLALLIRLAEGGVGGNLVALAAQQLGDWC
jgi:hypothetical protein